MEYRQTLFWQAIQELLKKAVEPEIPPGQLHEETETVPEISSVFSILEY